jgi:tetratricopeptide (TPR) repeat protein
VEPIIASDAAVIDSTSVSAAPVVTRFKTWSFAVLYGALATLPSCGAGPPSASARATSLAREHREGDAIAILREALLRHPDDLPSRRLLVRVLAMTGDLAAARREVDVLEHMLGSSDPIPWIELGHAYEMTHAYEPALEMYDHAADVAPADPRGPREGGLRAARWGEADWARPRLEEAVRRGADDVETWHALGLLRVLAKDLDQAELAYRAGLRVDPEALECHLGLATVAVLRADATKALVEYDILAAGRPGWAAAQLGRAWALEQLGRRQEAREAIAEAERLGGDPTAVARQRQKLDGPNAFGARRKGAPAEPVRKVP